MISNTDKHSLDQPTHTPVSAVQYARQLIEKGDDASLAEASTIYQSVLADPSLPAGPDRAEIETTYGALLCLQAQASSDANAALDMLQQALALLSAALVVRRRTTMPAAWATSTANLALVYITRYFHADNRLDVMNAHMALDGALEVFTAIPDQASADWVRSLRTYLVDLVERRQIPR